jgi:hypothetical protein
LMQVWSSGVDDDLVSTGAVVEQHGKVSTFPLLLCRLRSKKS